MKRPPTASRGALVGHASLSPSSWSPDSVAACAARPQIPRTAHRDNSFSNSDRSATQTSVQLHGLRVHLLVRRRSGKCRIAPEVRPGWVSDQIAAHGQPVVVTDEHALQDLAADRTNTHELDLRVACLRRDAGDSRVLQSAYPVAGVDGDVESDALRGVLDRQRTR